MASNDCSFTYEQDGDTFSCSKEVNSSEEYCIWHRSSDTKSGKNIIDRIETGEVPPKASRLRGLRFEDYIFTGTKLKHADFESATFTNIVFNSCNLEDAQFDDAELTNVDFLDCDLSWTTFGGKTYIRDSKFEGGNKNKGFEMKGIRCEQTDFVSFTVQNGSFYDTLIFGGECRQLTIRGAVLNLLQFRRAELKNCTFSPSQAKLLKFEGGSIKSTTITNKQKAEYQFSSLNSLEIILKGDGKTDLEIQNCSETTVDCRLEELGALRTTVVDGDQLSIRNGDIGELELIDLDFDRLRLDTVDATECTLEEIEIITRTNFDTVVLKNGEINRVNLSTAILNDTKLVEVDSTKFGVESGNFEEVHFIRGNHNQARFPSVDIENCKYRDVEFSRGTHRQVAIDDHTEFKNAGFERVDFEGATLNDVDLNDTSLERSILRNCDFRTATLANVRLHDAHMLDTRLNEATDFGKKCVYEKEIDTQISRDGFDIGIQSLDRVINSGVRLARMWKSEQSSRINAEASLKKAVRIYRDYQRVLRENSLRDDIRKYRVRERDAQRKLALARGKRRRWVRLMIERWSMRYGEGIKNIIASSGLIIFVWTFLYMVSGGLTVVEADGQTMTITNSNPITRAIGWILANVPISQDVIMTFSRNLYFSTVTFTTLGFGDIQPATQASRYLAAVESFLGAVLMALLVFVIGRRATW